MLRAIIGYLALYLVLCTFVVLTARYLKRCIPLWVAVSLITHPALVLVALVIMGKNKIPQDYNYEHLGELMP